MRCSLGNVQLMALNTKKSMVDLSLKDQHQTLQKEAYLILIVYPILTTYPILQPARLLEPVRKMKRS